MISPVTSSENTIRLEQPPTCTTTSSANFSSSSLSSQSENGQGIYASVLGFFSSLWNTFTYYCCFGYRYGNSSSEGPLLPPLPEAASYEDHKLYQFLNEFYHLEILDEGYARQKQEVFRRLSPHLQILCSSSNEQEERLGAAANLDRLINQLEVYISISVEGDRRCLSTLQEQLAVRMIAVIQETLTSCINSSGGCPSPVSSPTIPLLEEGLWIERKINQILRELSSYVPTSEEGLTDLLNRYIQALQQDLDTLRNDRARYDNEGPSALEIWNEIMWYLYIHNPPLESVLTFLKDVEIMNYWPLLEESLNEG